MKVNFSKASASGNDFVIIDNREGIYKDISHQFVKILADRRFGVGGDGVIFIENDKEHEFSMKYYNSNGYLGTLCGNGARCTARFIYEFIVKKDNITFEALGKKYSAKVENNIVTLKFPDLPVENRDIVVRSSIGDIQTHFLNTGSPHCIVFTKDLPGNKTLSDLHVFELGKFIRYAEEYKPDGANINFVNVLSEDTIEIRTYERGVEDETLACGSGSVASAIISFIINKMKQPVKVKTWGGETFEVGFNLNNLIAENLFLQGPANIVFNGYLFYDPKTNIIKAIL